MTGTKVTITFEDKTITAEISPKNVDKAVKDIGELIGHDGPRALKLAIAVAQRDDLNNFLAALALWLSCTQTRDGELMLRQARQGGTTIACEITDEGDHYNFATKLGPMAKAADRRAIH